MPSVLSTLLSAAMIIASIGGVEANPPLTYEEGLKQKMAERVGGHSGPSYHQKLSQDFDKVPMASAPSLSQGPMGPSPYQRGLEKLLDAPDSAEKQKLRTEGRRRYKEIHDNYRKRQKADDRRLEEEEFAHNNPLKNKYPVVDTQAPSHI